MLYFHNKKLLINSNLLHFSSGYSIGRKRRINKKSFAHPFSFSASSKRTIFSPAPNQKERLLRSFSFHAPSAVIKGGRGLNCPSHTLRTSSNIHAVSGSLTVTVLIFFRTHLPYCLWITRNNPIRK